MSETINTPQALEHPLTPEIIEKLLKFFNGSGNSIRYIDVVTINGDPRRITRHPTDKFLLKISGPRFTNDLDPLDPATSREFFILDETLAQIDRDSTDEGIERIKQEIKFRKELLYTCG